jgi:hypothetical protein
MKLCVSSHLLFGRVSFLQLKKLGDGFPSSSFFPPSQFKLKKKDRLMLTAVGIFFSTRRQDGGENI